MTSKKTRKKEEVVEEAVVEEKSVIKEVIVDQPRKWFVKLWERNEPHKKDIQVASIAYSEQDEEFSVDTLFDGRYGAAMTPLFIATHMITNSDGTTMALQPIENPVHFIQNMHLADSFFAKLYATEAVAIYETE
jgi:hypothetical protein